METIRTRTVIHFLWFSAKFGTCTVVSVNGSLVEAIVHIHPWIYAFYLQLLSNLHSRTTVQVPNLALTHKKRITVRLFSLMMFDGMCTVSQTLHSALANIIKNISPSVYICIVFLNEKQNKHVY